MAKLRAPQSPVPASSLSPPKRRRRAAANQIPASRFPSRVRGSPSHPASRTMPLREATRCRGSRRDLRRCARSSAVPPARAGAPPAPREFKAASARAAPRCCAPSPAPNRTLSLSASRAPCRRAWIVGTVSTTLWPSAERDDGVSGHASIQVAPRTRPPPLPLARFDTHTGSDRHGDLGELVRLRRRRTKAQRGRARWSELGGRRFVARARGSASPPGAAPRARPSAPAPSPASARRFHRIPGSIITSTSPRRHAKRRASSAGP